MNLLPLSDSRWANYSGGFSRAPFNVVPLISELFQSGASEQFWETVWSQLYHQGNVGEASYALVPYLVEYQSQQRELDERIFFYCATVDLAQPESGNPAVPTELEFSYAMALRHLPALGIDRMRRGCNEKLLMGIASLTALAAGQRVLARAYLELGRADALVYLHNLNGFEAGTHDA